MQSTNNCLLQVIDTVKWAVSVMGLLTLFVSFAGSTDSFQYDEFNEHLEKWRSHGITNYRMRFQVNCFCNQDFRRSKIIDVRNGLVHSAVYEDDGTPASMDGLHSIGSLFIKIEKSIRKEQWTKDLVGVYYNAEYGYPGVVAFDSELATDQYIGYKVKLLMIEKEDSYVSLHRTPEEVARTIYDEMVFVPTGTFLMGDLSGEGRDWELPVHSVTVPAFRLGKYAVTLDQWEACLADGGCNGYRPPGWGIGGNRPVCGVSWDDARSFIDWLNGKTGGNYRLPTEAEWEYAARAGSDTKFSWGDDVGNNRANCDSCGSQWDDTRAAVGSFPANAWGLHDMHGNVWEWVQDCWNDSYEGAPTDGSAWDGGYCGERVVRGGDAFNSPWYMRSAYRSALDRSYQYHGFRLAHDE